jgi:acyl carrier protein
MTELTARPEVPAREQVTDQILEALRKVLGTELVDAAEDTRLFEDVGLDSTTVLELLMAVEDRLGVELDAESLEQHHFSTVGTLCSFVCGQLAESL